MLRHCKSFCLLLAIAVGLCVLLPRGEARAYDEQASLDAALGYSAVVVDSVTLQGPSVDLGGSYGLTDAIVARATLGYAPLFYDAKAHSIGRLRVEAIYLLDVLKVVPFFGLGGTLTNNPNESAELPVWLGGHVVFGLDYLSSRTWTVGLDIRTALLIEGRGDRLSATDVALRVSRMFETF